MKWFLMNSTLAQRFLGSSSSNKQQQQQTQKVKSYSDICACKFKISSWLSYLPSTGNGSTRTVRVFRARQSLSGGNQHANENFLYDTSAS
jgi:hypothetical protein